MNELREHLDVCVPFDAQPVVSGDQDNIPGEKVVDELPKEQIDQGNKQVISEKSEVAEQKVEGIEEKTPSTLVDIVMVDGDDDSLMNGTCDTEVPVKEQPIKIIRVHRSLIRQDMLDIFSDESILKCTLSVIIINQHGNRDPYSQSSGRPRRPKHPTDDQNNLKTRPLDE